MDTSHRYIVFIMSVLILGTYALGAGICPHPCICMSNTKGGMTTDCSTASFTIWPGPFNPRTTVLNMTGNQLRMIPQDAFLHYDNLSSIDLSNNRIRRISKRTFTGLKKLKTIDLRRNLINKLDRYAFSELAGDSSCALPDTHCLIDLRYNDISRIEEYAFNMLQGLEIAVGHSKTTLEVEPYAFYGARDIREIALTDIHPQLILQPRVFTNTEKIRKITIANAALGPIKKFAFEGLKSVSEIIFYDCTLDDIEPYGFSGIFYTPTTDVVVVNGGNNGQGQYVHVDSLPSDEQSFGGRLNITSCRVQRIPGDLFKDTNLGQVSLHNNVIGILEPYIFRGMTRPQNISLVGNSLQNIRPNSLGNMGGLRHFTLSQNDIDIIPNSAFAGIKRIVTFTIEVRKSSNLSLSAGSFDGVFDVTRLEIKGDGDSHLLMPRESFRGMFGVDDMQFVKVNIVHLTAEAFKGLRKVEKIRFISCNIASLKAEPATTYDSMAGINSIDLSVGNRLVCDCSTTRVLREFDNFMEYEVNCATEDGKMRRVSKTQPPPECVQSSAASSLCLLLLPLLPALFLHWLN